MRFREDPLRPTITGTCARGNTVIYSPPHFTCQSEFTCPSLPPVSTEPAPGSARYARYLTPGFALGPCKGLFEKEQVCASLWVELIPMELETSTSEYLVTELHLAITPKKDTLVANITFSFPAERLSFSVLLSFIFSVQSFGRCLQLFSVPNQVPANVRATQGLPTNQVQFEISGLIPQKKDRAKILITHQHVPLLPFCVYKAECGDSRDDLIHLRSSDLGNFDPTKEKFLQSAVVEYECGGEAKFEGGDERIRFTCGLDGEWDGPERLPDCKNGGSALTS